TKSFNTMTHQLFEARAAVERNRTELETAKVYLESVLGNMSAGVMVLDGQFRLVSCNQSVQRILHQDFAPHLGKPLKEIEGMKGFSDTVTAIFSEHSARSAGDGDTALH